MMTSDNTVDNSTFGTYAGTSLALAMPANKYVLNVN